MVEGIIGFSDMSIVQTIGIAGTTISTFFSQKSKCKVSIDQQTRVLNGLDKPSEELAFVYYILWICSHAYAMCERKVLSEEELTWWS